MKKENITTERLNERLSEMEGQIAYIKSVKEAMNYIFQKSEQIKDKLLEEFMIEAIEIESIDSVSSNDSVRGGVRIKVNHPNLEQEPLDEIEAMFINLLPDLSGENKVHNFDMEIDIYDNSIIDIDLY